MRYILTSVVLIVLLFPSLASGETMDDLVERDGLHYKKFTDVPFTDEVTGKEQGIYKDGKKDGPWIKYWSNGQLRQKGDYKNGKREGTWVDYNYDGIVDVRLYIRGGPSSGGKKSTRYRTGSMIKASAPRRLARMYV